MATKACSRNKRTRRPLRHRRDRRGFALAIFLLFVVLGAVIITVSQLERVSRPLARDEASLRALTQAKEALVGYAATYRDTHADETFGYLPCPDTTGNGEADPSCGAGGQAAIGLLPYKSLGLPDLRDADGVCLWYAVAGTFKNNPKAVEPMNWDTQGQFTLTGTAIAPDTAGGGGGGAAVIFAAGGPLPGQNRTPDATTSCGVKPAETAAYLDAGNAFAPGSTPVTLTPGTVGSDTNNDRIAVVTPREIFDQVKKRRDLAAYINPGIDAIKNKLDAAPLSTASTAANLPVNPFTAGTANYNFYNAWRDNFRYLACAAGDYCYKDGAGNRYGGVLLWGGADVGDVPRPTTARNLANHFETPGALALAQGATAPACSTASASFDATTPASRALDMALCLKAEPASPPFTPTVISGTGDFSVATPSSLVSSSATTIELGSPVVSGGAAAGCIWYPTRIDFEKGLRVYFNFSYQSYDNGFTFALADAGTNPSTSGLCGDVSQSLGYAGKDISLSPGHIAAPKLGLEFDMRYDSDPVIPPTDAALAGWSLPRRHVGFVYWGTLASLTDDNTHDAGSAGSSTEPQNPATAGSGIRNWTSFVTSPLPSAPYHVRLDIDRDHDAMAQLGSYTLTAYLLTANQFGVWPDCYLTDFTDLASGNLSDINSDCASRGIVISRQITIADAVAGGAEAMKQIFLGFTTGQRAWQTQKITLSGFKAQNHR